MALDPAGLSQHTPGPHKEQAVLKNPLISRRCNRSFRGLLALVALAATACGSSEPEGTSSSSEASVASSTGTGGTGGTGGTDSAGGAGGNGGSGTGGGGAGGESATYTNPLSIGIASGGMVENCATPTVLHGQTPGDDFWYVYCGSGPLNDADTSPSGAYNAHLIPILKSPDLIEWTYAGDALDSLPGWAAPGAGLRAPDVHFFEGTYYLYYTVTDTVESDSAIGVATSDSPTGPWTDHGAPVVEPHAASCCSGSRRWVYDPHVLVTEKGQKYIYYGSYYGGISVRALSDDGFTSDPASQTEVTIPNRYEAAHVIERGGFFYLLGSASDCCNGPLAGYSVFAGRAESPMGPFVDREGVALASSRVGGTPVLALNGDRWAGTGHTAMLTDFAGQDWMLYNGVDTTAPYFKATGGGNGVGPVKRRLLMDALDWIDGWPTVRGGLWASDTPQPAPAARPGDKGLYAPSTPKDDVPGAPIPALTDEFDTAALGPQWSWVREPAAEAFGVSGGLLRFNTQTADLYLDTNSAPVLSQPAPTGDYIIETKVTVDVPPEGCCWNFTQAGLIAYKDDDNYVRVVSASIWDTRQVETAKEESPVPDGYPRFGTSAGGPAGVWTWLRIARRTRVNDETYTAYTSIDGATWVRAGTWTHTLGKDARIGLIAMGSDASIGSYPARFEYVRVFEAQE